MATSLKKIAVSDLRLGMYLCRFEATWLKSPFWRTGFIVDSPAQLRQAQQCGISECWIDSALGAQPSPLPPLPPLPAMSSQEVVAIRSAAPPAPAIELHPCPVSPVSLDEELARADAVCNEAREATRAMFNEARLGNAIDADSCRTVTRDISQSLMRNSGA